MGKMENRVLLPVNESDLSEVYIHDSMEDDPFFGVNPISKGLSEMGISGASHDFVCVGLNKYKTSLYAPVSGTVKSVLDGEHLDSLHSDIIEGFEDPEYHSYNGLVLTNGLVDITLFHIKTALKEGDEISAGEFIGKSVKVPKKQPHIHALYHKNGRRRPCYHVGTADIKELVNQEQQIKDPSMLKKYLDGFRG